MQACKSARPRQTSDFATFFKIDRSYVGKLGMVKLHQARYGKVAAVVGDAQQTRPGSASLAGYGKDTTRDPAAIPGRPCALAKIEEVHLEEPGMQTLAR